MLKLLTSVLSILSDDILAVKTCKDILLFGLAKITSPPDGTRMTFLPGSTAKLMWTVDNSSFLGISQYSWHLSRDEKSNKTEQLASVLLGKINISQSSLPGVAVEKPATLILKNIDLSYNGTYYFLIVSHSLLTGYKVRVSRIVVYIAGKLFCYSVTPLIVI